MATRKKKARRKAGTGETIWVRGEVSNEAEAMLKQLALLDGVDTGAVIEAGIRKCYTEAKPEVDRKIRASEKMTTLSKRIGRR